MISLLVICGLLAVATCTEDFLGCNQDKPLGMIDGSIQDWQITSSSSYPENWDKGCHERFARPYGPDKKGWCAKYKSSSEWLQIDLGVASKITGVLVQGRADGSEWVTAFMLSYSADAWHWRYTTDQYGNQKVFEGNVDSYTVKHVYLDNPIVARFVKFHTIHWQKHPSLRVELLGCQVCREQLGLPPYGKITVSSEMKHKKTTACRAQDGHLLSSKGWCARHKREDEWIQMDIGPASLVTALISKGRGDTGRKQWVTKYRVSFSNDSRIWHYYKDQTHLDTKLFRGNADKALERVHYLNKPFMARYVRFHPAEWQGRISMRVGLLGCPHTGTCGEGFLRVLPDTQCVENMALGKNSFINNKRQMKRHVRRSWERGLASRAVDGDLTPTLQKCIVLDNKRTDNPVWMVDLGEKRQVAGAVIVSWTGDENGEEAKAVKEYTKNLDKIALYVDDKQGKQAKGVAGNLCGFVTKLNGALLQPRILLQCVQPVEGRFVYLELWGTENRWSHIFSAVLCEVQIYS